MDCLDSEGVLTVWRVYDQAFGRAPKSGHVTSQKLQICIQTHVEKFTDSKNVVLFDLRRKMTKSSRKTVSEQWRHKALGRLELTLVSIHPSR